MGKTRKDQNKFWAKNGLGKKPYKRKRMYATLAQIKKVSRIIGKRNSKITAILRREPVQKKKKVSMFTEEYIENPEPMPSSLPNEKAMSQNTSNGSEYLTPLQT